MNLQLIKKFAFLFVASFAIVSCNDDDEVTPTETSAMLYATNNSDGDITQYNVENISDVKMMKFTTTSSAADGIYYDKDKDELVQASRTSFGLEGFSNISTLTSSIAVEIDLGMLGTTKMDNPREMAVKGNFYVVADSKDVDDDAQTPDGRFFVYERKSTGFELRNIITTNIKLWGITFIGNDLYAVVDADDELAVYQDFLNTTNTTTMMPTKRVVVEGIVRTHGIAYDANTNTMVMTDIGSATNTADDGGFHIIKNFSSKFAATANNGKIAVGDQIRVAGAATLMGNPVDVAYDGEKDIVYIAEAGNGGGRILAFNNASAGGNMTPVFNSALAAASSVYLQK